MVCELVAQTAEQTTADMPQLSYLIGLLIVAVGVLLLLILKFKVQAFLALLLSSLFVAIGACKEITGAEKALELAKIGDVITAGMGSSLGFIAAIIGLGAIFGALLEHSGGARSLASSMIRVFGEKRAPWAMVLSGFLISIPVFFDVALVIMAPIIYALSRKTGKSVLAFGLPLLAGIMVTHSFVPPTPGPVWVAYELDVSLGRVILFGVLVGLPTAIIAGILLPRYMADKMYIAPPELTEDDKNFDDSNLPGFGVIAALIGFPILLIVAGTLAKEMVAAGIDPDLSRDEYKAAASAALSAAGIGTKLLAFFGHPVIALMLATVGALFFLGYKRGVDKKALMEVCTRSLGPAGIIILITGAGGVFKQVLGATGVSDALKLAFEGSGMSVIVLAYIFAVLVRVAQGSATVAMVTAAGLVASLTSDLNQSQLALIVVAIAAGSSTASHVNDSGFWMISRYFRMTEKQTLQTWTVLSTVVSILGFAIALLLWQFV